MEELQPSIFPKKVEILFIQCSLKWNLLRCLTTDGGKYVCGAEKKLGKCTNLMKMQCLKPIDCSLCYQSAGALHKIFESIVLLNQLQWLTSLALT